ncbi:MAG: redoxin domain-containing protein [Mariprofundaceae bacterium]
MNVILNSKPAPQWQIERWFNTDKPISLEDLAGKVIVLHAFQMLCPSCVAHALPQAQRVFETFNQDQLAVIGIHTVFEHHDAMTDVALKAFVHEYRLTFPIGIDMANGNGAPKTMTAYQMQGTPTLVLIDKQGNLRKKIFGQCTDLALGAEIMTLIMDG